MKKLMLVLAAAAVAVCAQAASVDWQVTGKTVKDADGANLGGATYYLLNATAWNQTTVLEALAAGEITAANISSLDSYLGSGVGSSSTKTAGALSKTTVTNGMLNEGAYVDLVYVVFNNDQYFVSSAATAQAYNPAGQIETEGSAANFTATQYAGSISGGWQTAGAVPEPTSGLLLLLGMAGLALRRKQA